MAESFFTSGNQIVTTEIDVDSPYTDGLMSKIKGRDVELSDKIVGLGGTGVDGDVIITANMNLSGIKHYNNFTINAGVTVTVDQGKPLIIFARGTVTINGTIDGNGKGALTGGTASGGGSGGGGSGGDVAGDKGGDSHYLWLLNGGAGGAVFGNGAIGIDASWGRMLHIPTSFTLGGAGGGNGSNGLYIGAGGNGGGFLYIEAPTIIINSTGIVTCNGNNGTSSGAAAGGGGGGGVIFFRSKSYTNYGTLTVTKGNGATGGGTSGGNGGAGVVYSDVIP